MRIADSFTSGVTRVAKSPALAFWLYVSNLILTIPLGLAMKDILKESIGSSLIHQNLRQGLDLRWYGEFSSQSHGLAATFTPTVVGILPVLRNLERFLNGRILQMNWSILLAGTLFLLSWAFFTGGIIDRYARPNEPATRSRFLSLGGEYFLRFVRLLIISLGIYWAIFHWIVVPLFSWLEHATRDVTVERTVMLYTLLIYALLTFLLMLISMAFDYTKISMVVEKRRSVLLALARAARFIASHAGKTTGLYLLLTGIGILLLLIYWVAAPGTGQSEWLTVLLAFLVSQVFILGRVSLKLWFLASQTALFQSAYRDLSSSH